MSFFFHLLLPDNIKQDAYKTAANSKQITDTLKKKFQVLVSVIYGIIQMDVMGNTGML